ARTDPPLDAVRTIIPAVAGPWRIVFHSASSKLLLALISVLLDAGPVARRHPSPSRRAGTARRLRRRARGSPVARWRAPAHSAGREPAPEPRRPRPRARARRQRRTAPRCRDGAPRGPRRW